MGGNKYKQTLADFVYWKLQRIFSLSYFWYNKWVEKWYKEV